MKKALCLLLALLMIAFSLAACAKDEDPAETTDPAESQKETEPEENDPFAGVNYKGETFDIYTSVNQATVSMSSSNNYIEGPDEVTGDAALDTALKRNNDVMERLNVNFSYNQVDLNHEDVAQDIRQLVLSGDTTYELIINDIWGLVPITPEGLFRNSLDGEAFDFDQPWWYSDFMSDIALNTNMQFALAGDYFIDMLRCTHCLVMNKDIYRDLYGDPDDVYQTVIDRGWTIDKYQAIVSKAYIDKNGNGEADEDDQYGSVAYGYWGPLIPWVISGDPGFIDRDEEGYPFITVNNERSLLLLEKLNTLFHDQSSYIIEDTDEQVFINMFTSGNSLFLWYQRLASLESESLRRTDVDLAVLPYPMLDENQKDYVTSTHDTAELGFIPMTVANENMPFVSTVIEVLCRETNRQVLPTYYESSLKIKYTRDKLSGQMIDIIHDHYGNGFALAWSGGLDGIFLSNTFRDCIVANDTNFASEYKKLEKTEQRMLKNFIKKSEDVLFSQSQQQNGQ